MSDFRYPSVVCTRALLSRKCGRRDVSSGEECGSAEDTWIRIRSPLLTRWRRAEQYFDRWKHFLAISFSIHSHSNDWTSQDTRNMNGFINIKSYTLDAVRVMKTWCVFVLSLKYPFKIKPFKEAMTLL